MIRIVDQFGRPLASTDPTADLGPPQPRDHSTPAPFASPASRSRPPAGPPPSFSTREPDDDVEASLGRLWLFLGAGVIGGTLLALLAGLAVADRAMRPIASLTALARDITTTRDPSRRMPVPAADDEVGELAETMDGMLEALDEARGERERAFERQREFVADASHELRTPLTSVQANLELLQASLAAPRRGPPRGRLGAGLDEADVAAGLRPLPARPRRRRPALGPHRGRPGEDRTGRAATRSSRWSATASSEPTSTARCRSRATPTSSTAWSATCSRTPSGTRPSGSRRSALAAARRG